MDETHVRCPHCLKQNSISDLEDKYAPPTTGWEGPTEIVECFHCSKEFSLFCNKIVVPTNDFDSDTFLETRDDFFSDMPAEVVPLAHTVAFFICAKFDMPLGWPEAYESVIGEDNALRKAYEYAMRKYEQLNKELFNDDTNGEK